MLDAEIQRTLTQTGCHVAETLLTSILHTVSAVQHRSLTLKMYHT